jgi:hypothetical protein
MLFKQFYSHEERLFNDDPYTYTRCQENIEGLKVIVGGFAAAGLDIRNDIYDYGDIGVAALRNFF